MYCQFTHRCVILRFPLQALTIRLAISAIASTLACLPGQGRCLTLEGDTSPIHDPAIIQAGGLYYVFASNRFHGELLPVFRSRDLRAWQYRGHVFERVPGWAAAEVPGARGIWAPDISYGGGQFRLYYAVSVFGHNRSVIGVATNRAIDPDSPEYHSLDRGRVIGTTPRDNWNAIDPNLATDEHGSPWLAMGSFWSGIKLRKIDPQTGKLSGEDTTLYSLAARPGANPPAIEAPFIARHGRHFYLFVSFDLCCRGRASTYKIMVGRARRITGPYADRAGKAMLEGGGTLVLDGSAAWRGPGGQSVLHTPAADYLVFHAYDAERGRPFLQISMLKWKEGWPEAGELPQPRPDLSQTRIQ